MSVSGAEIRRLLAALERAPGATAVDLFAKHGVKRDTLRELRRLAAEGLVYRERGPAGRGGAPFRYWRAP